MNEWGFVSYETLVSLESPTTINKLTVWLGASGKDRAFYPPLIIARR